MLTRTPRSEALRASCRRDFGEVGFIELQIEQAVVGGDAHLDFDGVHKGAAFAEIIVGGESGALAGFPVVTANGPLPGSPEKAPSGSR